MSGNAWGIARLQLKQSGWNEKEKLFMHSSRHVKGEASGSLALDAGHLSAQNYKVEILKFVIHYIV
jgi:hypothetical protein